MLQDDLDDERRYAELQAVNYRLQKALETAKAKTEDLIAATYRAAADAIIANPLAPIAAPKVGKGTKGEEVALWHLTDWQGAKVTTSYNTEVMRTRVQQFATKAHRITEIQRAEHPVRDCVILFGGDMVEGLFNFPTQVFEVDATIFEQWVNVSNLLAETVATALTIYSRVQVVAEWGNHGRIGSKRDAVPTSDNIDRMCYQRARDLLGSQPRLTWEDCPEDIQRVEVGNYRALSMHGDETGRAGYVSPTTFGNYLNGLQAGAYGWAFRDVYSGHYHTHQEIPMKSGQGAWYQTGSTESTNRYAIVGLGSTAQPSQRLHFIEPVKGVVTAQYKVRLD